MIKVRFCPQPNCANAMICESSCIKCPTLQCAECRSDFCFVCRKTAHKGKCVFEVSTTLKPCPHCGVMINKALGDGCNAMICSVCRFNFCWLCMKQISMDGVGYFTTFSGCTFFGDRRWSSRSRKIAKGVLPIASPLVIAGIAFLGATTMVVVPPMLASDEWRRSGSLGSR
jgi:hypothetical protein